MAGSSYITSFYHAAMVKLMMYPRGARADG